MHRTGMAIMTAGYDGSSRDVRTTIRRLDLAALQARQDPTTAIEIDLDDPLASQETILTADRGQIEAAIAAWIYAIAAALGDTHE